MVSFVERVLIQRGYSETCLLEAHGYVSLASKDSKTIGTKANWLQDMVALRTIRQRGRVGKE